MGRQEMEAELALVMSQGRVEPVRPMKSAAIDNHDDLFAGGAEGGQDLMNVLAQLLGHQSGARFYRRLWRCHIGPRR